MAGCTADVYTFVAAAEVADDVADGRTLPCDAADCAGTACRNGRGVKRCGSRFGRGGVCRRRCRNGRGSGWGAVAVRFDAEGLADADGVVCQAVPCAEVVLRNLVTFGNVIDGIAAHYGVCCSIDVHRRVRRCVRAGRAGRVAAVGRRSGGGRGIRGVVVGRIGFVRRCTIWIVGGCVCRTGIAAGIAYDDGRRLLAGACAEYEGEGCRPCVKCGFFNMIG